MKYCEKCGNSIQLNDNYCTNCGNVINNKSSKKNNPLLKLLFFFVIIFSIIAFFKIFFSIREKSIINKYDVVIVGDNCNCAFHMGDKCRFTYGIKGNFSEDILIKIKDDSSNIYRVSITQNIKTYFDKETWYEMYKENGYGSPFNDSLVSKYIINYKYNKKDKETFNKIISLIDDNDIKYIRYFIITKNNYYIFNSLEEIIYRYDTENNTLVKFFELKKCNIDYFYEK